jgi:hypothetical protein
MEVTVRLFVRRDRRWVAMGRQRLLTGTTDVAFRAVFEVEGSGRYLARAAFDGDTAYEASRASDRFRIRTP